MSQDLIRRYKNAFRLQLPNREIEAKYRETLGVRGRSSSVFAFLVLAMINAAFGYLEYRAFGLEESAPMYGYIILTVLSLVNFSISQFSSNLFWHVWRLIGTGVLSMCVVLLAVYLQNYSAYHVAEMVILLIWMGSLNSIRFIWGVIVNAVMVAGFLMLMAYHPEIRPFWIPIVAVMLCAAVLLASYLSYITARQRRMLFLQNSLNDSVNHRMELWAFTLIDIDMALSGIMEFKELIDLLKKHLEPVIEFDSYVLTSLEGQGPRPHADKIEGSLFEDDDGTIWSEDLLNKLTQTRQATVSAEFEEAKGIIGKQKKFTSYRLDVPVFNDSKLLGVISLRRESEPFDDLDMVSSVSIATQAMLIFKRTVRNAALEFDSSTPDPVINKVKEEKDKAAITASEKLSSYQSTDMDVTDYSATDPDQTPEQVLAPDDLVKKMKQSEEKAKKTITLLSRENADKIAVDRYRTAAVEGEPLSVLIIEVDGLSKLREQDGDQVAYKVFAAIVKYIFSKIDRDKDILGRYGQNGLSVLMPKVDMNAAEKFAEMIRDFVDRAKYKTAYGEKAQL